MARYAYHHDPDDFGDKILRGPSMVAHLDAIAQRAGEIARATAPEDTGEFKESFVVGTAIEDHKGLRAVGFLVSTDPAAEAKEFTNPDDDKNRTMNKAMRKAIG